MPHYKTHTAINLFLALPLLLAGCYFFLHPTSIELLLSAGTFIYTTLFMSPDMDLAWKVKWYSLRGLLSLPFRSYSRVFRHRGVSHSLIFGSLTRILWLAFFILIVLYISTGWYLSTHQIITYFLQYKWEMVYSLMGIMAADIIHVVTDRVSS